jgi:hypothetical protein
MSTWHAVWFGLSLVAACEVAIGQDSPMFRGDLAHSGIMRRRAFRSLCGELAG